MLKRKLLLTCLFATALIPGRAEQEPDALYRGFQDPPSRYRPMPIWYWNGDIRPDEAKRQIDAYAEQGAQGALVYPAIGLRTPFLSEQWWRVWAEILPYARQKGFKLGWMPDFNHPQGDARDVWMDPPDQSRVIQGHPEYRLHRLTFVRRQFTGPGAARFDNLPNAVIVIAGRRTGPDSLDADSLADLSSGMQGSSFEAALGPGQWLLTFYYPVTDEGTKGRTRVDQLIPEATQRYIDLTLEEFYRRFKDHVGNTLAFVMLDHEGSYGGPIVWTPGFFDTFRKVKGYDFRKYLPLLVHDGGDITPKIRNDYFDVVTEMFVGNFWEPLARWGEKHGVAVVGQSWGDWLQLDPGYGGDFLKMQRAMAMPFTEEEESSGRLHYRDPRQFREPASIAHFEGKPFACECLLVQGVRSFVSPQKMRMGTNVLAAWGVNLWNQNTSYDEANAEWPPQMGRSQPHWKFFHHYSDLVRRLSYMNDQGRHAADVVMFRPIASVVTCSDEIFDPARGSRRAGFAEEAATGSAAAAPERSQCGAFSGQVEADYHELMLLLARRQRDHDVFDDHYLARADIGNGAFRIAGETFHVLVLPRMNVISRASLDKIRRFYDSGGKVIAYGTLPSGSTEQGWNDPNIRRDILAIFGVEPGTERDTENRNANGGTAVFVHREHARVADAVDRASRADLEVEGGPVDQLVYSHRVVDGRDYYWVASDMDRPRRVVLSLAGSGKPELWDPASGERKDTPYRVERGRVVVPLDFSARDGVYVVLTQGGKPPAGNITATNLLDCAIRETPGGFTVRGRVPAASPKIFVRGKVGERSFDIGRDNTRVARPQVLSPEGWKFDIAAKTVPVRYARESLTPAGQGLSLGYERPGYNDRNWQTSYLASERMTVREWQLIGPFPNQDHAGYNAAYPPESGIRLDASYPGLDRQPVRWQRHEAQVPEVDLVEALSLPRRAAVEYALTYVYSPSARTAHAVLVTYNAKLFVNGRLAFKHHPMPRYFEYRDGFGFKTPITLKQGWNEVLVKIEHDTGASMFYLRLCDEQGLPVPELLTASLPTDPERLRAAAEERGATFERWYRLPIPPGTRALLVPPSWPAPSIYLKGKLVKPVDRRVEFPSLDWSGPNVAAIRMAASGELPDCPEFEAGSGEYRLGSWTGTGLSYFSGEAAYEKIFDLNPDLPGKHIELDCGEVGVTAEVWLNGSRVGDRVWSPFRFDVTRYLKPGRNVLRIAVTNTDANRRAAAPEERYQRRTRAPVGAANVYLDAIALNGLIGPVQLIPYVDTEVAILPADMR